ncbi:MAG: hypothetical protein A2X71_09060 [Thiobacillus sp. GWE1_62_9]|nr:MAG: hypothetical protein A2X71_09060 [Thiobacillus sp. GWE1_62_9]
MPPQYHDAHEIVIAAKLWPVHCYQQIGCKKLACLVEQHLLLDGKRRRQPATDQRLSPPVVRMARRVMHPA